MTPRKYQSEAISTITSRFSNESSRVVLAAATGSGKTEIAIMLIDSFVKSNFGKVLVIAHHTNIIKDNFCDRLTQVNPDFSWSCDSVDVDCFVTIRQNIINLDLSQFSFVIVDEAHQNYFADTIKSRIDIIKHQVLLTATPSKFVADGSFDILAVARLDIPNKYYARLNFQIINADNSLDKDDYNTDGVVKSSFVFTIKEMKSAVDSVMPYIKDGKKLFICRDITHANATAKYLTSLGVESFVSDFKSDADGSIADSFKSGQIQSLVVVDRMRLGYSDNNLYYTIDLSFTHNADTIHQMMSRSNRGSQLQNKFYIKVTNDRLNTLTRVILSVSIALMKRDNLLSYNGKNFSGVQIPVARQTSSSSSTKKVGSGYSITIPDFGDIQNFFDVCDFVDADDVLIQLGLNTKVYYTYEDCVEAAKSFTSYQDFQRSHKTKCDFLRKSNKIDVFLAKKGWSKQMRLLDQNIFESAKSYDRPIDFAKSEPGKYTAAQVRGLLSSLIYKSGLNSAQIVEVNKQKSKEALRLRNVARAAKSRAERAAAGKKSRAKKQQS